MTNQLTNEGHGGIDTARAEQHQHQYLSMECLRLASLGARGAQTEVIIERAAAYRSFVIGLPGQA